MFLPVTFRHLPEQLRLSVTVWQLEEALCGQSHTFVSLSSSSEAIPQCLVLPALDTSLNSVGQNVSYLEGQPLFKMSVPF